MAAEAEVGSKPAKDATNGLGRATVTEHNVHRINAMQNYSSSEASVVAQQSSSLPPSPHMSTRSLHNQFRTPSPDNRAVQSSSPRTARSESDTTTRPPGRTLLAGCKYETGIKHFKRRMPYSLGSDKLESSPTKVKKHLDSEEEKKLTSKMRELYSRLQPTKESEEKRARFVTKLDTILNERWPGNAIQVHVFGSSGNSLFTNDSDVDICITTTSEALQRTCLLAKALGEHGMQNIECRPNAKVPIVKMWDPELELACDMNVNNTAALNNTRMMKAYVQMDHRVKPLAMIIKHWTRRRALNDAALGGTLSSYTWLCMIVNFLQCRHPKILPSSLQKPPYFIPTPETPTGFNEAPDLTRDFGKPNRESLGDLLFAFFRKYAHEVDYERFVISVREGSLISKAEKRWHPSQNTRLCVEEPFNISRNLGNTADDTSFRGVHLELRRAFDLISHGKLEECLEEYIFPTQEERVGRNESLFTRPTPQPRPVLTRSQSQTGSNRIPRAGPESKKNGFSNQKQKTGGSNRRASSALPPFKIPVPRMPYIDMTASGSQLHESLAHEYQKLQKQEQQLRLKMQSTNGKAGHVIGGGNGNIYYMDPHSQINSEQHRRHSTASRSSQQMPIQQFTPITNLPGIVNFLPPGFLSGQSSSPQTVTNPPSPSLSYAQPRYRSDTRRSATMDTGSYPGTRSHSQPPANNQVLPQQVFYVQPEPYTYGGRQTYGHGYRTLQDIQNEYLMTHPHFFNADWDLDNKNCGDLKIFDSPTVGSEIDSASVSDDRFLQDYPVAERRAPKSARSVPVHIEDVVHDRQRFAEFKPSTVANTLPPRPRSSSLLPSHGISFFAVEPVDSPPHGYAWTTEIPDFPTPQARGMTPDPSRSARPSSSGFTDDATSPEQFSDYTSAKFSYSVERTITPTSSIGTPSQENNEPFTLDGNMERPPAQKVAPPIQFGQFPARAPYRFGQQPKSDDIKGSLLSQGPGRALYSQTLNGLGINLINESRNSSLDHNSGAVKQSSTVAGLNLASTLKPGSMLSPVREVRTPSPTATRNGITIPYPQPATVLKTAGFGATADPTKLSSLPESAHRAKAHHRARSVESVSRPTDIQPQSGHSSTIDGVLQMGEPSKPSQAKNGEKAGKGVLPHSQPLSHSASQPGVSQTSWQQSGSSKKKKNKKSASVGSVTIPFDRNEKKGG